MLLLLGSALMGGCGQGNRQVLDFFFTGIPDEKAPTAPRAEKKPAGPATGRATPIASAHSYFIHRQCFKCHGTSMAIISSGPQRQALRATEDALGTEGPGYPVAARQLCLKCHKDPFAADSRPGQDGHPPVVCTVCHQPHQSEHINLLKDTPEGICSLCHSGEMMEPVGFHHQPIRRQGAR
jgi:predicted CXXCH cytochrome family protein